MSYFVSTSEDSAALADGDVYTLTITQGSNMWVDGQTTATYATDATATRLRVRSGAMPDRDVVDPVAKEKKRLPPEDRQKIANRRHQRRRGSKEPVSSQISMRAVTNPARQLPARMSRMPVPRTR